MRQRGRRLTAGTGGTASNTETSQLENVGRLVSQSNLGVTRWKANDWQTTGESQHQAPSRLKEPEDLFTFLWLLTHWGQGACLPDHRATGCWRMEASKSTTHHF